MKKSLFLFLFTLFFLFFSFGQKKISDAQFDPENPSQNARGSLQGAGGSAQDASAQGPDESITAEDIQIPVPEVFTPLDYVPEIFYGIWEGDDRYIMFQNQDELASIIGSEAGANGTAAELSAALSDAGADHYLWLYLKTFYGWYIDRAAEKTNRKNTSYPYDRNDTVFRDIQNIKIEFKKLVETKDCAAFEIIVKYPRIKEKTVIPVAVIGDSLYLDFAIKTADTKGAEPGSAGELRGNAGAPGENAPADESRDPGNAGDLQRELYGSWSGVGKVSGIKVSQPIVSDSLYSMYITENGTYYIRYWKTDMPYSDEFAFFSDGTKKYSVPKHIQSAGRVYTCVTGRSLTIRNVEKRSHSLENYVLSEEKNVLAWGEPYLKRIDPVCSLESMMKIVKAANSRRMPTPPAPFPPTELDWNMDDITRIELGNEIVQAVRRRQREFAEKHPDYSFDVYTGGAFRE